MGTRAVILRRNADLTWWSQCKTEADVRHTAILESCIIQPLNINKIDQTTKAFTSLRHTIMDRAKGVVKGGWHPKGKDGGKESWRGEFKGINQVVWAPSCSIISSAFSLCRRLVVRG